MNMEINLSKIWLHMKMTLLQPYFNIIVWLLEKAQLKSMEMNCQEEVYQTMEDIGDEVMNITKEEVTIKSKQILHELENLKDAEDKLINLIQYNSELLQGIRENLAGLQKRAIYYSLAADEINYKEQNERNIKTN